MPVKVAIPGMAVIIVAVVLLAIVVLGMTDPMELIILALVGAVAVGMYTGKI